MILPRVGLENSWLQSRRRTLAFSPVCLYSIQNFSFQVFSIGRAVPTPAVPLGCQTVPVSSVREEVRPQRPPVQTHQSPPFSTNQPDGSRCKLMHGELGSPGNPAGATVSLSRGRKPQEQEDVDVNVQVSPPSGTSTGVCQPKHALSCRPSRLWSLANLLSESSGKWHRHHPDKRLQVAVDTVGASGCFPPHVCPVLFLVVVIKRLGTRLDKPVFIQLMW